MNEGVLENNEDEMLRYFFVIHCRLPGGFHLLFIIFRALILDTFYCVSVF